MTTELLHVPSPTLKWNIRQLYWDVLWFGILAGSTLAFQSVYAVRLGATGLQIGLISAGPAVVGLMFTLPSGRWIEGKSLIKVSFQSSIWQRLGYLVLVALPWLFPSPEGQVWGLIWMTLVVSVAGTVLAISFNAMFAEVVPPDWRAYAVGRRNIIMAISITLTTILSGQILDRVTFPLNYQVVFLVGATGALLSSYHLGRIRKPDQVVEDVDPPVRKTEDGTLLIKRKSLLRLDLLVGPFGIFLLSYLAFYAFQYFPVPLFPIAYVDKLHMTDGMIGLGTAIFYGAMMAASFRLGYVSTRYGHRKVLIVSAALFPIFPLLMAIATGPALYYLACLIGGAVNAMLTGAVLNRLMERVPPGDRPAHMTLHNLALNLGVLAGSLLGPLSAGLFGLQPALYISAALRLIAAGLFWLWG
jgi:predicted MFS family arabinose efflux permease